VDSLDKEWEHGVPSVWEGELGQFGPRDQATQEAFALRRLRCHTTIHNFDLTQMGGSGNLADNLADNHDDDDADDALHHRTEPVAGDQLVSVVRNLCRDYFHHKLVEHFYILWQQNKTEWPKQHGCPCPRLSVRQSVVP
jgi:hypothetical protein